VLLCELFACLVWFGLRFEFVLIGFICFCGDRLVCLLLVSCLVVYWYRCCSFVCLCFGFVFGAGLFRLACGLVCSIIVLLSLCFSFVVLFNCFVFAAFVLGLLWVTCFVLLYLLVCFVWWL